MNQHPPDQFILLNDQIKQNCFTEIERRYGTVEPLIVSIDKRRQKTTVKQRGYVFGCAYSMIQAYLLENTGQRFNVQHMLHPYHVDWFSDSSTREVSSVVDMGGGERKVQTRMSQWNPAVMNDYIPWLQYTYAPRGLYIPDPDKFWKFRGSA